MPYKRKGHWYSDIRPRVAGRPTGERIRKLLPHVKSKWEAERAENKMAAELLYGEEVKPLCPLFEDFARNTYLPWARQNKRDYRHDEFRTEVLCQSPQFKGRRMDEISAMQFEYFKKERKATKTRHKRDRAWGTITAELAIARSIFRLAKTLGVIERNPTHGVKDLDTEPRTGRRLGEKEETKLFRSLRHGPDYLEPCALLSLNTGMREGEVAELEVKDVDFVRDLLFIRNPKWRKDKRRTEGIPLNTTARNILFKLCRKVKSGPLFRNRKGEPLTRENVASTFRNAAIRAGMKGFRFHDLRHEFGSRLGDRGFSPYEIARLIGHSDIKMSMIYVHPRETNLQKAVASVDSGHMEATRENEQTSVSDSKHLKRVGM